jgi:UDP-glucose 4-epimerase
VISAVQEVTGLEVEHEFAERRPGDPAALVASAEKAREVLGWQAEHDLDAIVRSAWNWMQDHPNGYRNDDDDVGDGWA